MLIFPFASGWADWDDWARLGWSIGFLNFDNDTLMNTQYSDTMATSVVPLPC